jgi:hypothetical protein
MVGIERACGIAAGGGDNKLPCGSFRQIAASNQKLIQMLKE